MTEEQANRAAKGTIVECLDGETDKLDILSRFGFNHAGQRGQRVTMRKDGPPGTRLDSPSARDL